MSLSQALTHDETGAGSHSLKNGQLSLTRWNTLMAMMFAPGATPLGATDGPLAPATMPATCVPWKQPLSAGSQLVPVPGPVALGAPFGQPPKHASSTTRPARNGWLRSTPVSSTATVWPLPLTPRALTFGDPTIGVVEASAGVTSPSSRTSATWSSAASASISLGRGHDRHQRQRLEPPDDPALVEHVCGLSLIGGDLRPLIQPPFLGQLADRSDLRAQRDDNPSLALLLGAFLRLVDRLRVRGRGSLCLRGAGEGEHEGRRESGPPDPLGWGI